MKQFDHIGESREYGKNVDKQKEAAGYRPANEQLHLGDDEIGCGDDADQVLDESLSRLGTGVEFSSNEKLSLGDWELKPDEVAQLGSYGIDPKLLIRAESGDFEAREKVVKIASNGVKAHSLLATGPAVNNYFFDPSLDFSVRNSGNDNDMLWNLKDRYSV